MGNLYRKAGRTIWMMKYYVHGRAQYESSGETDYALAGDVLKRREAEIAKGASPTSDKRRLTLAGAAGLILDDYAENGQKSGDKVEERLRLHILPALGEHRLRRLTAAHIRQYRSDRLEAGAAKSTVNRELAVISRIFHLAHQADLVDYIPAIPRLAERNARKGFFGRSQFAAVLAQLPEYLRGPLTVAYYTGWRARSEVFPLTWARVDRDERLLLLDPDETKNDEGRTFPYGVLPALVETIDAAWLAHEQWQQAGRIVPWVFPRPDGERIGTWEHYEPWRAACKASGTPGRIPHDFRRTAVRELVRAGVPETQAMQLTGHKTRAIFDRYDIVDPDDLRHAVERLASRAVRPEAERR